MSLYRHLLDRRDRPVGVALIGAGKFGSMFLSQALRTPGMRIAGIADLSPDRARAALARVGFAEAPVPVTDDAEALIAAPGVEVVVEATGDPAAGLRHALRAFDEGRHVVMVNVEADVLAGPLLSRRAAAAGVVYSLAYGDQPALIAELVDWARTTGFEVVAAGKGTLYMPEFETSTPDTVWRYYGLSPERAAESGLNAKMFNSFLDGTKSAIEMAAVANATGLDAPAGGLAFPPVAAADLARTLIPGSAGGVLSGSGLVEVVSSRARDGRDLEGDLRWGVYVTFEAPSEYVENCFADYGIVTDPSGRYAALWRPYHLIGLELGVSVASAALRGEATGAPEGFRADVVATAKRDLAAGEILDGEGGFTVRGRLMPAADSLAREALPIGLAHGVRLRRAVAAGDVLRRGDVEIDPDDPAVRLRAEMERSLAPAPPA